MSRKLHELIAVEPDLKGTAEKILQESIVTFTKKDAHFMGHKKTYEKFFDNEVDLPPEDKPLVDTVNSKLKYTFDTIGKAIDALVSKEVTNTQAKANVVVEGHEFLQNIPAVVLINLENQFKKMRDLIDKVPTLDPSENWQYDSKLNQYVADDKVTFRTKKVLKNHVKYEATKEHPAQVETYSEDIPVGKWFTKKFSGMLTPAEKSEMLERADNMIRAFKEARERANDIPVQEMKIADRLFGYILSEKK